MLPADPNDVATVFEEAERDSVVACHVNRIKQPPVYIDNERVCMDCYDPIPIKRIEAYPECVRCVCCEDDHQKKQQHIARR